MNQRFRSPGHERGHFDPCGTIAARTAAIGAELPMPPHAPYAGSCPKADAGRRHKCLGIDQANFHAPTRLRTDLLALSKDPSAARFN